MDQALKQRLIGASVLIALAVIFLPAFLTGPETPTESGQPDDFYIPPEPDMQGDNGLTRRLPVLPPAGQMQLPGTSQNSREQGASTTDPTSGNRPERIMPIESIADASDDELVNDSQPSDDSTDEAGSLAANETDATSQSSDSGSSSNPTPEALAEENLPKPAVASTPVNSQPSAQTSTADIGENDWSVQIATLGNPDNVSRLSQQLQRAGIAHQQQQIKRGGTTLFRIVSGPYASQAGAEAALNEIKSVDNRLSPQVINPETELSSVVAAPTASASKPAAAQSLQRFAVQTGVFSDAANANGVVSKLTSAGYAAYAEQITSAGKTMHRVRIGPLLTEGDADKMIAEIKKTMQIEGIVVAYP